MGIKRFFHNVGAFFVRIFGKQSADAIQKLLIEKLLPIAIQAVTQVEELSGLKGTAKRDAAVKIMLDKLGSAGKDIKASLLNLAIETALAEIEGVFGPRE